MAKPKRTPEELAAEAVDAAQAAADAELPALREARRHAKAAAQHSAHNRKLLDEVERLDRLLEIALDVRESRGKYLPMRVEKHEAGVAREGCAVLLYSDIHPEEIVDPSKVSGLNEFSPDIARERVGRLVEGVRWALETVRAGKGKGGYHVREFFLALLGDLISNSIHEDLSESNALGPADAVNFVFELIQTVIDALLQDKQLERIMVPCCLGNHDRMTRLNRHQTKAETSLATIIYYNLKRMYRNEPRVQFDIARGNMLYSEVYGKKVRWTHGDDIRYSGGVGGLTIPMRKAIDSWNRSVDAALTCCGHWHQVLNHSDFVVNGSVIGYTAYAQAIKARFEPAQQAFFIIDPEHGKRFFTPIDVQGVTQWS